MGRKNTKQASNSKFKKAAQTAITLLPKYNAHITNTNEFNELIKQSPNIINWLHLPTETKGYKIPPTPLEIAIENECITAIELILQRIQLSEKKLHIEEATITKIINACYNNPNTGVFPLVIDLILLYPNGKQNLSKIAKNKITSLCNNKQSYEQAQLSNYFIQNKFCDAPKLTIKETNIAACVKVLITISQNHKDHTNLFAPIFKLINNSDNKSKLCDEAITEFLLAIQAGYPKLLPTLEKLNSTGYLIPKQAKLYSNRELLSLYAIYTDNNELFKKHLFRFINNKTSDISGTEFNQLALSIVLVDIERPKTFKVLVEYILADKNSTISLNYLLHIICKIPYISTNKKIFLIQQIPNWQKLINMPIKTEFGSGTCIMNAIYQPWRISSFEKKVSQTTSAQLITKQAIDAGELIREQNIMLKVDLQLLTWLLKQDIDFDHDKPYQDSLIFYIAYKFKDYIKDGEVSIEYKNRYKLVKKLFIQLVESGKFNLERHNTIDSKSAKYDTLACLAIANDISLLDVLVKNGYKLANDPLALIILLENKNFSLQKKINLINKMLSSGLDINSPVLCGVKSIASKNLKFNKNDLTKQPIRTNYYPILAIILQSAILKDTSLIDLAYEYGANFDIKFNNFTSQSKIPNLNITNNYIDVSLIQNTDKIGYTEYLIHNTVEYDNLDIIKKLVEQYNCNPNPGRNGHGKTALDVAITRGEDNQPIMNFLLEKMLEHMGPDIAHDLASAIYLAYIFKKPLGSQFLISISNAIESNPSIYMNKLLINTISILLDSNAKWTLDLLQDCPKLLYQICSPFINKFLEIKPELANNVLKIFIKHQQYYIAEIFQILTNQQAQFKLAQPYFRLLFNKNNHEFSIKIIKSMLSNKNLNSDQIKLIKQHIELVAQKSKNNNQLTQNLLALSELLQKDTQDNIEIKSTIPDEIKNEKNNEIIIHEKTRYNLDFWASKKNKKLLSTNNHPIFKHFAEIMSVLLKTNFGESTIEKHALYSIMQVYVLVKFTETNKHLHKANTLRNLVLYATLKLTVNNKDGWQKTNKLLSWLIYDLANNNENTIGNLHGYNKLSMISNEQIFRFSFFSKISELNSQVNKLDNSIKDQFIKFSLLEKAEFTLEELINKFSEVKFILPKALEHLKNIILNKFDLFKYTNQDLNQAELINTLKVLLKCICLINEKITNPIIRYECTVSALMTIHALNKNICQTTLAKFSKSVKSYQSFIENTVKQRNIQCHSKYQTLTELNTEQKQLIIIASKASKQLLTELKNIDTICNESQEILSKSNI